MKGPALALLLLVLAAGLLVLGVLLFPPFRFERPVERVEGGAPTKVAPVTSQAPAEVLLRTPEPEPEQDLAPPAGEEPTRESQTPPPTPAPRGLEDGGIPPPLAPPKKPAERP